MKYNLFLIVVLISGFIRGQQEMGCKTDQVMKEYWEEHPEAYQEFIEFNEFSTRFAEQRRLQGEKNADKYIIPVVFHVYGNVQNGASISVNTIENSVDQVNEEFQGLNADFNTVDALFDGIKSSLNIEFKLAKIDPDGNATNGVVFHPFRGGYGNNDGGTRALIAQDAWDNYKYMNVYIQADLYNDGSTTSSGVAWYPSVTDSNANVARIVYNGQYLTGNTSQEFASVLTHEFGHWVNLVHTHDGGCGGTDFVSDTPQEDTAGGAGCVRSRNCLNEEINYENYMGYNGASGCYKMFTQGQIDRVLAALEHPSRKPLWQPGNLIDTGTDDGASAISIDGSDLIEDIANDGSIEGTSVISAFNTTFKVTGTLTEGVHYTTNFPNGLGATIVVSVDGESAMVTYTGNATSHIANDSTEGNITFTNEAIEASSNVILLNFEFSDPYQIIYVNNPNLTVDTANAWEPFTDENIPSLGGGTNYGGLFYHASGHPSGQPALQFETYTAAMVTTGNSSLNVAVLPLNTPINTESNWVDGGAYPDLHDISTVNYTTWNGQTSYAGFRFKKGDREFYGWLHFQVNADGSEYTLLDYAYNTEPFGEILAGQRQTTDPQLSVQSPTVTEAASNNGALEGNSVIEAYNTTFNVTGVLTEGTHYTTNIPSGIGVSIEVNGDGTIATVTYSGNASSHTASDSVTGTITFTGQAVTVDDPTVSITYEFIDPYQIIYVNNTDLTVNSSNAWEPFTDENIPSLGGGTNYGGLFYHASGHPSGQPALQFETYTEAMVTTGGSSLNVAVLPLNTPISSSSNWVEGGAYPDLHDISTNSYSAWNGQIAYAGFRFKKNNKEFYGWLRFQVSNSGSSYTLLDYAYTTEPYGTILAGQTEIIDNGDTEAPTAPQNLVASGTTTTTTNLSWDAATDNVGVVAYDVYQGNTIIQTVSTTQTEVTGLTTETQYSFYVKAKDEAGNISEASNTVTITTMSEQEYCTLSGNYQTYEWIAGVNIGGVNNVSEGAPYTFYSDQVVTLTPGGNEDFTLTPGFRQNEHYTENWNVWIDYNSDGDFEDAGELVFSRSDSRAVTGTITVPSDASGNTRMRIAINYGSQISSCGVFDSGEVEDYPVSFGGNTDTEAPTTPQNLVASGTTTTTTSLSWDASVDNIGVEGYEIYQDDTLVTTVTTTSHEIAGLTANTTYTFYVKAKDAAGNTSGNSNSITVTTLEETIADYCDTHTTDALDYYYIENVSLGAINNSSVLANANGYSDYTSQTTTLTPGTSESMSVTISTTWEQNKVYAFIDWNKDGDFEDAGELVFNTTAEGGTQTINVPLNAVAGTTVMRVRVSYYFAEPEPCEIAYTGETEDYSITIGNSAAGPDGENTIALEDDSFKIYPNPVQDRGILHIAYKGATMNSYRIYNMIGQTVKEGKFTEQVDVSQLEGGMYLIELIGSSSKINTRFIKR